MGEAQPTLGLFSYTPSINIGDPYARNGKNAEDRIKGKQFSTNPSKKGKTPDVTFSKFETLAVGDPYVELAVQQRRERNKRLKEQLVPQPFKPSNPTKRSTGHGSYFGTFNIWENVKTSDDYDKRQLKKGEKVLDPKNILTSPPKRGTYGMVGTNIGGRVQGFAGEYEYQPSGSNKPRPATAPDGEKLKPFVPSSPAKKGTYGYLHLNINGSTKPKGSQGEYTYMGDPIHSARSHKSDTDALKPFRPSHPPQKGRGFFGTFKWEGQHYIEDPEKEKWAKAVAERKAARERNMGLIFRPSSHPKSTRTTSVTNHPRNQDGGHPAAVNARIFSARHPGLVGARP
mmetsp:Transcript_55085/g.112628  ORF Transcript_55085/g.112628 Transcript_55085/m.112628 type:complete len:342 (-) Transcript_55085:206-1231(-)|eukprot:CAMPEP_0181306458 /NCGR_PEP_ID=MMETSP1101-20121128/10312_1 /TAXON_ID=46948 /ORGANISM="Rhodomonas abbreviata, Strain Caron Lab Isolate" /LENGTH=341 /DNA_ID=CAMNT_0023412519 /DNA_START=213 /DNA_END=1238 /DNA_ORIENTATION=+